MKTLRESKFGGRLIIGEVKQIAPDAIWRLDISSGVTRSAFSHSLGQKQSLTSDRFVRHSCYSVLDLHARPKDVTGTAFAGVFCALFFCFHLPELLVRAGVPAGGASLALLLFFPAASVGARWLACGFSRAYALELNARSLRWFVFLFLASVLGKAVALTVGLASGVYTVIDETTSREGSLATAGAFVAIAAITFVPSLAEDMLTRGLWARAAPWRWRAGAFLVVSALVYLLNHVWRLQHGPSEWALLLCFGLAYAAALWQTGTLWAAVGLHWGWNFAGSAADRLWQFEVVRSDVAWTLSAGIHLILLAALLAFLQPKQRR